MFKRRAFQICRTPVDLSCEPITAFFGDPPTVFTKLRDTYSHIAGIVRLEASSAMLNVGPFEAATGSSSNSFYTRAIAHAITKLREVYLNDSERLDAQSDTMQQITPGDLAAKEASTEVSCMVILDATANMLGLPQWHENISSDSDLTVSVMDMLARHLASLNVS